MVRAEIAPDEAEDAGGLDARQGRQRSMAPFLTEQIKGFYGSSVLNNCGSKIKVLAHIQFWLETVTCVVLAFVLGEVKGSFSNDSFQPVYFFSLLLGGPLISYVSSVFLHAFGELVENPKIIAENSQSSKNE